MMFKSDSPSGLKKFDEVQAKMYCIVLNIEIMVELSYLGLKTALVK